MRQRLVCAAALALAAAALAGCGTAPTSAPVAVPPAAASPAAAEKAPRATILWDEWGIPHVRAADEEALFYAYGWAQAHNHAQLLVESVARARARGAEVWGEEALADDRWYRTVGLPAWTRRTYGELEPAMRRAVDRFADGIGAYLAAHPGALSSTAAAVLPISGEDVVANLGAVRLEFSRARQEAEGWRRRAAGEAALAAPEAPAERAVASNAWALGPAKSASGNALLLANPHLPWGGNLTWIEAHLTAPGIDVYGASLVGMPVITIGFNRRLGWTHTVNTQDDEDLYRLDLVDGGYRFDGGVRPFERRVETIRVKTADGFRDEEIEVLSSVHGPVLATAGDEALALRRVDDVVAGFGAALGQWWAMGKAGSFDEFVAALESHAIAGQNVTYADADGRIAYFYGGVLPLRLTGGAGFWAGLVAGDDPLLVWETAHGFHDMPRVVDPDTGWLQNANDPPWLSTFPPVLDADVYPPYFAPRELSLRPQQSIELLRDSGRLTLDEMVALKHSTEVEMAERVLPDLLAAVEDAAGDVPEVARRAAAVLAAWDGSTASDSRGAVLFAAWVREMLRRTGPGFFALPWDEAAPLATPAGLADPAVARQALAAAAAAVEAAHGGLGVAWGEVNRLRVGDHDLPGNGGPGSLGVFRVTWFAGGDEATDVAVAGDSFVAAVEFAAAGPRALALVSYGNASQPGSPHRGDQLPLYAEQRLRPVRFAAGEVEAAAVERTELALDEAP